MSIEAYNPPNAWQAEAASNVRASVTYDSSRNVLIVEQIENDPSPTFKLNESASSFFEDRAGERISVNEFSENINELDPEIDQLIKLTAEELEGRLTATFNNENINTGVNILKDQDGDIYVVLDARETQEGENGALYETRMFIPHLTQANGMQVLIFEKTDLSGVFTYVINEVSGDATPLIAYPDGNGGFQYVALKVNSDATLTQQIPWEPETGDLTVDGGDAAEPTDLPRQMAKVIVAEANVRSGPGTEYVKSGSLTEGQTVNILGQTTSPDGYIWYQISETEWVREDLLQSVETPTPPRELPEDAQLFLQVTEEATQREGLIVKSSDVVVYEPIVEGAIQREIALVQTNEMNGYLDGVYNPNYDTGNLRFNYIENFHPAFADPAEGRPNFRINGEEVGLDSAQAMATAVDQALWRMALTQGKIPEGTPLEDFLTNYADKITIDVWGIDGQSLEIDGDTAVVFRFRGFERPDPRRNAVQGEVRTQWGTFVRSKGDGGELIIDMFFSREDYTKNGYEFQTPDSHASPRSSDGWYGSMMLEMAILSMNVNDTYADFRQLYGVFDISKDISQTYDPNKQILPDYALIWSYRYDPYEALYEKNQVINFS